VKIEVDMTYRCNLKCVNCCRLCNREKILHMVDRKEFDLKVKHIDFLVSQIRSKNKELIKNIHIMGGEPVLSDITYYAIDNLEKLRKDGFKFGMQIISNLVQSPIDGYKKYIKNFSKKKNKSKVHRCISICPADKNIKGRLCLIPSSCGICYNVFGFSMCGEGGSIMQFTQNHKYYLHYLPDSTGDFLKRGNFEKEICSYCSMSGMTDFGLRRNKYKKKHDRTNDDGWYFYTTEEMGEKIGPTWQRQIEKNKKHFEYPDTTWIEQV
jgi:hypothetical protein